MSHMNNDLPEGYRMTELGPLPEQWTVVPLGEIAEVRGGYGFPHRYQGQGRGVYPFAKVSDMNLPGNEFGVHTAANYVNENVVKALKARPFPESTVIFPKIGAAVHTNKKRILRQASLVDNNVMGVTVVAKDACDPEFLVLYFATVNLSDLANPGPLPSITAQRVKSQPVPLPPLGEQRAIASVLSAVQEARQKTEGVIVAARALKQSLMKYLFTYGPVPVDEAENVKLKETEIGQVPEEWGVVRLGDVARVRYGLGQPPAVSDTGVPMIRATNVKRGRIVVDGLIRVKREAIPESREPYLKAGDVIVVRSGAYTGDVAMVTADWEGSVAGYDLVVTPSSDVHSGYCAEYLLARGAQAYFRSQRDRSAQPHLNAAQLSDTRLPLPSPEVQGGIATALAVVEEKLAAEESRKQALDELFRTLLNDLMTAKLRVKDLEVAV